MWEGTWGAGELAEGGEGSETSAGAVMVEVSGSAVVAVAVESVVEEQAPFAAEGALDEEVLPCGWV